MIRIFKREPDPRLAHAEEVRKGIKQANSKLDKVLEDLKRILDEKEKGAKPC